jgi:hypothetical protein
MGELCGGPFSVESTEFTLERGEGEMKTSGIHVGLILLTYQKK